MLGPIVLCVACVQSPVDTLKAIQASYASLESYSATLRHHNSSGLFPGEYSQRLRWRKGNRFELLVTDPNPNPLPEGGAKAPDFYSDGKIVVSLRGKEGRTERPLAPEPNSMPGWEVSGGPVMWFLLGSTSAEWLYHPPQGFRLDWKLDSEVEWRGERAQRLIGTISGEQQDRAVTVTFYFVSGPLRLVGYEYTSGQQTGWCKYLDQRFNPDLPKNLGEAPKGE